MPEIDWTVVLSAAVTGGGLLTAAVVALLNRRKPRAPVATENDAAQDAYTRTGNLDGKALSIAQDALEQAQEANKRAAEANGRAEKFQSRLESVEGELDLFRRSYNALYWAWQRVITEWDELREDPNPPPTPQNIHHP